MGILCRMRCPKLRGRARRRRSGERRTAAQSPAVAILGVLAFASAAAAQEATSESSGPRDVVERWFRLADELDDTAEAREAFLALYREDALHIQGPAGPNQQGTTTFWGRDKVRLLVERLAADWGDANIRADVSTAREVSEAVWPETPGPWGGSLVAAQFTVAGTRREDGIRWTVPGAAFFRVRDGELLRVRIYLGLGEAAEVKDMR